VIILLTAYSINIAISQVSILEVSSLYLLFFIIIVLILAVTGLTIPIVYHLVYKKLTQDMVALNLKEAIGGKVEGSKQEDLNKIIEDAGYAYDSKQDIFYSRMDAWQRNMGFCHLYDEASAPFGMVIDCEPIYFEYGGKRWLIEFWKGQYDLTTGGEIGVYTTEAPDLDIPGFFKGSFYHCASNADCLEMDFSLKKNNERLFKRKEKHWWLTGFKLGEFSEPSELTMKIKITLKNKAMCTEFVNGLKNAGYSEREFYVMENTVYIKFDKPHTPQPITRTAETDRIIQKKNKLLCDKYQEITSPYDNFPEKVNAIHEKAPEVYEKIISLGKSERIFKVFDKYRDYLG
jgi:hypothetical protein